MKGFCLVTGLFLSISFLGYASQACDALAPQDYLIFSGQNIQYTQSDFQGPVGAMGDIELSSFQVKSTRDSLCSALVAGHDASVNEGAVVGGGAAVGSHFTLSYGSVDGLVQYGEHLTLNNAWASGKKTLAEEVQNLPNADQFFQDQSAELASMSATARVRENGQELTFAARGGLAVYEISAERLARASVLRFYADRSAEIVINVRGDLASVVGKGVVLHGGIGAGQIILNFPDASSLKISDSGNEAYGIPATILAPHANLDFTDGRVTGGIYVGGLSGNGQANAAPTQWLSCGNGTASQK